MNSELPRGNAGNKSSARPLTDPQSRKIRERSFAYALRAIKLYQHLQKLRDGTSRIVGKQFLRGANSIGANVEEAQSSESLADFLHKLGIAQKEARESLYWLRLLSESGIVPRNKLDPLIQENEELVKKLTSIILTTKRRREISRSDAQRFSGRIS
jgi:four helix bundle protein